MEIPQKLQIQLSIEDSFKNGRVFRFKNREYDKKAKKHWHIVIETNQPEVYLVAVVTSRKWEGQDAESIAITPEDLDCLSNEKSYINLHGLLFPKTKDEIDKIADEFSSEKAKIDPNLKNKIIDAVRNSRIVQPHFKKLLP